MTNPSLVELQALVDRWKRHPSRSHWECAEDLQALIPRDDETLGRPAYEEVDDGWE